MVQIVEMAMGRLNFLSATTPSSLPSRGHPFAVKPLTPLHCHRLWTSLNRSPVSSTFSLMPWMPWELLATSLSQSIREALPFAQHALLPQADESELLSDFLFHSITTELSMENKQNGESGYELDDFKENGKGSCR